MIWPEAITGFICGCIAANGHVNIPCEGARIAVISTIEKSRAKEVVNVLRDVSIRTTLCKGGKSPTSDNQKWVVFLSAKNAQHEILLDSILHWKMEDWFGEYKLNRLKNLVDFRTKRKHAEGQIPLSTARIERGNTN